MVFDSIDNPHNGPDRNWLQKSEPYKKFSLIYSIIIDANSIKYHISSHNAAY